MVQQNQQNQSVHPKYSSPSDIHKTATAQRQQQQHVRFRQKERCHDGISLPDLQQGMAPSIP